MAKQGGMGDNFYIGGYNISGDVGSLGSISGGNTPLEVTGISSSGIERLGGQRSGQVEFSSFWNDATGAVHPALSTLPTTDRVAMYFRGTTIGNPAAALVAKQVNYDPTRAADGSLTTSTQVLSNSFGLEWGISLTAGFRTGDSGAFDVASADTTASASFGGQAYLQVGSFSGTDCTIKIQDSADNAAWADVAGLAFTTITGGAPLSERISISNTATIRRYVHVAVRTATSYSNLSWAVVLVKNMNSGVVF